MQNLALETPPSTLRSPGRPRSGAIDDAILNAAVELLESVGPEGTTISAVVRRSGIARASVYLRYPARGALVAAAIRRELGRVPYRVTGDIEKDLRTAAEQSRTALDSFHFRTLLPLIISGLLRLEDDSQRITYETVAPNRHTFAEQYRALAADSGFRTDIDAEIVPDMVLGGLLIHLLATGSVPSTEVANQMIDVIVAGLRAPRTTRSTQQRHRPSAKS